MLRTVSLLCFYFVAADCCHAFQATKPGEWPWWRGPNSNGVAEAGQDVPTSWSENENVLWKVPIPGRGHSSPTIVGDKIFLATADEVTEEQFVLGLNRADGKELWNTKVSQGGFPKTHPKNTHASCTVACDGERVFVAFHHDRKVTLAALDVDGNELWRDDVGRFDPRQYEYGYAPSPLIYKDTVIIAADYERGGFLAAYDRGSGKQVWKVPRPRKLSFSSPVVAKIAGKDQLLISGCEEVRSYNPASGKLIWGTPGTTMATCGTMVWDGDLVFASGGYPRAQTICVKADGSKQVMWRNNQKCYEQSMMAHKGYLYAATDRGIAYCWRARDGQEMWRGRLESKISASPVLVGDNIFQSVESGRTFVFRATPSAFEKVAENKLGEQAFATPTICGNRIYLRVAFGRGFKRQEFLYCIGKPEQG